MLTRLKAQNAKAQRKFRAFASLRLLFFLNLIHIVKYDAQVIVSNGAWRVNSNSQVANWEQPGFDDSGWLLATAPSPRSIAISDCLDFDGFSDPTVMPIWDEWPSSLSTVYLRRTFTLSPAFTSAFLTVSADDDIQGAYINGTFIYSESDGTAGPTYNQDVTSLLVPGVNVIAIKAADIVGGLSRVCVQLSICSDDMLGSDISLCPNIPKNISASFPGATYLWSTGETTAFITVSSPGTYSVTLGGSCSQSDFINVTAVTNPTLSVVSAIDPTCGSANGSIEIAVNGGASPFTYKWSPSGGNTATAGSLSPSIYYVLVTDANECKDAQSVEIENIEPSISIVSVVSASCYNSSDGAIDVDVAGGLPPYLYRWSNGETTQDISGLTGGIYTFSLTDANLCFDMISQQVTKPGEVFAGASASVTICSGKTASLTATATGGSGGYTYTWLPNTPLSSPTSSQIYYVTATDNDGCESQPDSTSIIVNPAPLSDFTVSDTIGCPFLCVTFVNTTPNSANCTWNYGDGFKLAICDSSTHCYTNPGIYTVSLTVSDINGCASSVIKNNLITVYSLPTAVISISSPPYTTGEPVMFSDQSLNSISSSWNFGNGDENLLNEPSPAITYTNKGSYLVILIASNDDGCVDTTYQTITVEGKIILYTPNAFTPNGDEINDIFLPRLNGSDYTSFQLTIYDRWGNHIYFTDQPLNGWSGSNAQEDTYIWAVTLDGIERKGRITLIR